MKIYFTTFADHRMKPALERIKQQAESINVFDYIYTLTENDLDDNFKKLFKSKLITASRGFGYWCWKPQVILQTFRKMEEGDILIYCDAGVHINPNGKKRLLNYVNSTIASSKGMTFFIMNNSSPKQWIKKDAMAFFGYDENKDFIATNAIIAGTSIILMKCSDSYEIIEQWLNIFINNWNIVDDSASKSKNFPEFIEHRHDQAILTMLSYKYKARDSLFNESEIHSGNFETLKDKPILAKRDRAMETNILDKLMYLLFLPKRILRKIKLSLK